jgi:hypothetical protein
MSLLTFDQICSAEDRDFREVEVPEWGGTVRLGAMTSAERDAFEAGLIDNKGKKAGLKNFRARFVACCLVDENGERLFTASNAEQLGKKASAPLARLFDVCQELNGMSKEDVEELEGN